MLTYALLLNPLHTNFAEALSSLRLNNEAKKVDIFVYANFSNITLTDPTDIPLLHYILYTHEQATDAKINRVNLRNSFWGSGTRLFMNWVFLISLKQNFRNNITRLHQPKLYSVKYLAHENYIRYLRILQRIRVAHTYLLSKIWFGTQILLIPEDDIYQINSFMT
jgi:hypothetical protein